MNMTPTQIQSMHLAAAEMERMSVAQRAEVLIHSHRAYFDTGRMAGLKIGFAFGIIVGTLFAWLL